MSKNDSSRSSRQVSPEEEEDYEIDDRTVWRCEKPGCVQFFHDRESAEAHKAQDRHLINYNKMDDIANDEEREEIYVPAKDDGSYRRKAYTTTRIYTHPNAAIECNVDGCPRKYSTMTALRKHKRQNHPEVHAYEMAHRTRKQKRRATTRGFECPAPGCGEIYVTHMALRKHKMEDHTPDELIGTLHSTGSTPAKSTPSFRSSGLKKQKMSPHPFTFSDLGPEPEISEYGLQTGEMATVGGKIFFVHPTEGVCVVRNLNLDEPYMAIVTLRHAVTGDTREQAHSQLDFTEFSRLGFKVEYHFDEPMDSSVLTERNAIVDPQEEILIDDISSINEVPMPTRAMKSIKPPSAKKPHLFQLKKKGLQPVQRSLKCNECSFKTNNSISLKEHYSKTHAFGKEPFICKQCYQCFRFSIALQRHTQSDHPPGVRTVAEQPSTSRAVHCPYCEISFSDAERCARHIEQTHPEPMEGDESMDRSSPRSNISS